MMEHMITLESPSGVVLTAYGDPDTDDIVFEGVPNGVTFTTINVDGVSRPPICGLPMTIYEGDKITVRHHSFFHSHWGCAVTWANNLLAHVLYGSPSKRTS